MGASINAIHFSRKRDEITSVVTEKALNKLQLGIKNLQEVRNRRNMSQQNEACI